MDKNSTLKTDFWIKVKKVAGKVPFIKDAIAMYYCMIDSKTPLAAKAVIAGALAYFVFPVDTIPDIILGFGYVDDASVIAGALAVVKANVLDEHYKKAEKFLSTGEIIEEIPAVDIEKQK